MYCTQCGASIQEKELKCPYCGAVNPFADEQKYMERLQKILRETEDLSEEPMRQYGRELKSHGKHTLKISLAIASVFLILAVVLLTIRLVHDRQDAASARARLALEQKYIPQLEKLYEEENFEEVSRLLNQAYEEAVNGKAQFFSWDHSTFMYYYECYQSMASFEILLHDGSSYSLQELEDALYDGMVLYKEALLPSEEDQISPREKELISSYQTDAGIFLRESPNFTEEEIDQLYHDSVQEGGYLSIADVQAYAATVAERLNSPQETDPSH